MKTLKILLPSSEPRVLFQLLFNIECQAGWFIILMAVVLSLHPWWLQTHSAVLPAELDAVCQKPSLFFTSIERLKAYGWRLAQSTHCRCAYQSSNSLECCTSSFYHLVFGLQPRNMCTCCPSPRRFATQNVR